MSEVKHENLNAFIGAVIEPPLVFIVSAYCQKGNLRETLENDTITLDTMFVSSIIFDILKISLFCCIQHKNSTIFVSFYGMHFIHTSPFGSHGRLKSMNCLIDSRWQVKISDYGLPELRSGEQKPLTSEQNSWGLQFFGNWSNHT